jgi:hypothetical protein
MQTLRALRIGESLGALRRWAGMASERRAVVRPVVRALRGSLARWTPHSGPSLTPPLSEALDAALRNASAAPAINAQALRALVEMRVALDFIESPRNPAGEESQP